MKAGHLYVGEYYAWVPKPPKGRFSTRGKRVRLRAIETRRSTSNINAKTFALITEMESGRELSVPAREIVDFWHSYEGELNAHKREEAERKARVHRDKVRSVLVDTILARHFKNATGYDGTGINVYGSSVRVPVEVFKEWLGVTDEMIEKEVDQFIERENGEVQS